MPSINVPAHAVLIYGDVLRITLKVGANATAAKMIPGALVIYDAVEGSVKEAGAKAHGILGVIDVDPTHDIGDNYAVGAAIPILCPAPGAFLALILLANEDVIQGDRLVSALNGLVAEQAVGAMGSQGDVIGIAWDTSAVAQDARIIVLWSPSYEPAAAA